MGGGGTQDVAHILNDETQRKYIQSVKRLMTYSQNKYPPDSFCEALEPTAIDTRAPTMLKMQGKGVSAPFRRVRAHVVLSACCACACMRCVRACMVCVRAWCVCVHVVCT